MSHHSIASSHVARGRTALRRHRSPSVTLAVAVGIAAIILGGRTVGGVEGDGATGRVRVDVGAADGRRDTGTPGWETWKVEEGPTASRTLGDVSVTLRCAGEGDEGIETFLTKAGIDTGATMATDGVQSARGIELEIRGLAPGPHTIVTYHNSIRDEPVGRVVVSCAGAAVGAEGHATARSVRPSRRVTHDHDAASAFLAVDAAEGSPVVIRILPDEGDGRRLALLNGFEIDGVDPRRRARKPFPAPDDEHVDGDAGHVELRWTPAASAIRHDVYLASDRDPEACAARVAAARREDAELLCSVREPRATADIVDRDSLLHYSWRVDEVDGEGRVTRGEVLGFRVRHLAFPGAEGYGRHARGGRGGRVIEVTSLADSGPGTLRAAVEAEGPRTVVFNVSGLITLESKLVIRPANSYLTVAGQTAPGKGICIRNWTFGALGARDVILRHVRLRLGNLAGRTMDGMGLASADHSIIDHCSISWTIDEAFSSRAARNITLQRTLISEALNEAGHRKYPPGTRHGYAASIGGDVGSFHHNLLAHCAGRNWSLAGGLNQAGRHTGRLDIRNNVVFNWDHRTTDGGAKEVQFVGNYYKPGPASRVFHVLKPERNPGFGPQDYWVEGNIMEGRYGPGEPLAGVVEPRGERLSSFVRDRPFFEPWVTTHSAEEAYESVLSDVGCNVPALDEHDRRVIDEVRRGVATHRGSRTGLPGIPDTQDDVGGWDEYPVVRRPEGWDRDHDGLPDHWEAERGLDPESPADGALDPDGDGYTNLEDYLSWLASGSPDPGDRRHRVVVSTDIGGTDPDDLQSMVHLLLYADVLDIEGLVSSPYGPGRKRDILRVIERYAEDHRSLRTHSDRYPAPEALRAIAKQGETEAAPWAGVRRSTEGSEWIVRCARREDPRPLHVLVWGGLEDLAQALHDAPDILEKLRVYWIGGPNKKWSPNSYQHIVEHFPTLWIIESNATYRGWFTGGDQSGAWGNEEFVSRHVAGRGALGEFFRSQLGGRIKMGDTPSVGWLLRSTPEDPSRPGWGGRFVRAPERPHARFRRLTTREDRIEVFSILELVLPLGGGAPERPEARLVVENQSLIGHVDRGDGEGRRGTVSFRFCPKAAKGYRFRIRSNVPALDGRTGGVTAVAPGPDTLRPPSPGLPHWWTDDPAPELAERGHIGARTVSRWRRDFLRDFAERMLRCARPRPATE